MSPFVLAFLVFVALAVMYFLMAVVFDDGGMLGCMSMFGLFALLLLPLVLFEGCAALGLV